MRLATLLVLLLTAALSGAAPHEPTGAEPVGRMSFHNRLLLNRAVVSGLKSIEVLVLAANRDSAGFHAPTREIAALVGRLGGRVRRVEGEIGYLVVDLPTDRLLELVNSPALDAYQIASLSKAAWYRDGPPQLNAEGYRGKEVTPIAANEPRSNPGPLPPLSVEASREAGYTADEDVGLREWMAAHPTFDGRGVTIAIVENAVPAFTDPTLRTAKSLEGRDIPKIAGIVNAMEPESDETRVALDTHVRAETTWTRIGGRTYVLPRPGTYRFGALVLPAGGNVVQQFGVIQDERTREVWIDANGDASFQDESPLADVNERFEPRSLRLAHSRSAEVSFVMGRGHSPDVIHIYVSRGSHQTMTLSVAAGSKTPDSLAFGVAPHARVLLVRHDSMGSYELVGAFQGFIEAAKRPDVDVIGSASGFTFIPDTAADFAGLLFRRLVDTYQKPIFLSAGNNHMEVANALDFGPALSVGGSLGPGAFASLRGGRTLDGLIVHLAGAAGPSRDGAIKPDFVAPMERLAADLPWNRSLEAVPTNTPAFTIPPGYRISCCTSASAPYAAGVAAILISAARQSHVPYSAHSLARAMKVSAGFITGFPAHAQGNGALDINAAWQQLTRQAEIPRIVASTTVVHPLAQYSARGSEGVGILEFEGWVTGMTSTREIRLRRESGPASPIDYRLTWTGNDGTFKTLPTVTLPLGRTVSVPIVVVVKTSGAHSALLELRDLASNGIAFRTQATVLAAERLDGPTVSAGIKGRVGQMQSNHHYFAVPQGSGALVVELDVSRGVVRPTIVPAHGLFPAYYLHVHPMNIHTVGRGRHAVVVPNPEPGTWTVSLENSSTWLHMPDDVVAPDDGDAEYVVTARIIGTTIRPMAPAAARAGR